MYKTIKTGILFSLLLSITSPAAGDSFHYACKQMTMESGLSSPTVTEIFEDSSGTLWIGTRSGLNSFYTSGHRSYNLGGAIVSITQDSCGDVWVSTELAAFRYNPASDSFNTVLSDMGGGLFTYGDEVWVYWNNSIQRIHLPDMTVTPVSFPPRIRISAILPSDGEEVILGSTFHGLWKYNPSNGETSPFCKEYNSPLCCLLEAEGRIYAGARRNGVSVFGADGRSLGRLKGLETLDVTDMALVGEDIWITTDGSGVYIYNIVNGSVSRLQNIPSDDSSLPSNAILSVCASSEDIWLGTVRSGIVNVQKHYIKAYGTAGFWNGTGLSGECAYGLCCDEAGIVWIGTDGHGLNSFDPGTGSFRYYPSTADDYIPVVAPYGNDGILMMRYHKGMFILDKKKGNLRPLVIDGMDAVGDEWNTEYIHYCCSVPGGEILIYGPLLYAHNPRTGSTGFYSFPDGSPADWVHVLWQGQDFFLASKDNVLYINHYDSKVLDRLCDTGPDTVIRAASFDRKTNRIWLLSDRGTGYVDCSDYGAPCSPFKLLDDVPYVNATTLTVDSDSRVWISADMHLYLYRPDTGTFNSFGPFDGYPLCDILNGWNTEVKGDVFYLAGTSGLISINTALAQAVSVKKVPAMTLSELISDKKRFLFGNNDPLYVKLPWNHGTLTLNYKVSNLAFYDNATYVYTISGQDKRRVTSHSAHLEITSLPPGEYVISAHCSPARTMTGVSAGDLRIRILRPWYKSVLFTLFVLVVMVSGLIVLIYSIVKKNLEKGGVVENAISDKDREFLMRFNDLVEQKMGEEHLDSDYLTVEFAISRTVLFARIKKLTGYSLNDYIKRLRINKAAKLLKETGLSVTEISEITGFSYPRYFSSVFKDLTGVSPTEFRNQSNTTK